MNSTCRYAILKYAIIYISHTLDFSGRALKINALRRVHAAVHFCALSDDVVRSIGVA